MTTSSGSSGKGTLHTLYGPALSESYPARWHDCCLVLEKAVKAKGGPFRSLDAVTIQDTVSRGDQAELTHLKGEVTYDNKLLHGGSTTPPLCMWCGRSHSAGARLSCAWIELSWCGASTAPFKQAPFI